MTHSGVLASISAAESHAVFTAVHCAVPLARDCDGRISGVYCTLMTRLGFSFRREFTSDYYRKASGNTADMDHTTHQNTRDNSPHKGPGRPNVICSLLSICLLYIGPTVRPRQKPLPLQYCLRGRISRAEFSWHFVLLICRPFSALEFAAKHKRSFEKTLLPQQTT